MTITASGDDTAKVFSFTFGIPKSVGKNFTILGHYNSLSALQAAVPNPEVGDAYSVNNVSSVTAPYPYLVYVYDGVTHAWANYGELGSSSIIVDDALNNASTNPVQNRVVTATFNTFAEAIPTALPNPNALSIFGSSYDGSSAVTINKDTEISVSTASSTNAVTTKAVKDYVDGLIGDIDTAITAINTLIGTPVSET